MQGPAGDHSSDGPSAGPASLDLQVVSSLFAHAGDTHGVEEAGEGGA